MTMLKKWLKKRRSSTSKNAAEGGFEASISSDINTTPSRKQKSANRLLKQGSGKTKKDKGNKSKSASRKSSYKNIEKEESRLSFSHPIITPIMGRSAASTRSSSTNSKKDVTSSLPSSSSTSIARLPTATPSPDNGATTVDNNSSNKSGDNNSIKISKMKIIAAIDRHGEKKERTHAKIKPIQGPRDHPRTSVFNASSTEQHKEAPPPPAAEMMARDMSLLGVASFPSIDTALFGHGDGDGDDDNDNEDPVGVLYGEMLASERERDIPPSIIQAILPAEVEAQEPPGDATRVQEMVSPKPLKDEDFLSGTPSQSGTGSKKLQAWINEVKRSIENTRYQEDPNIDRYHMDGDETIVEEKSDKDVALSEKMNHHEALLESQNKIEQSLRETIQKSIAQKSASPKGILKNKTFESGTIQDEEVTSASSEESSSDPVSSEGDTGIKLKRTMAVRPIKVFSKSRRQRLRERSFSTEDEATASIASHSSSGSDIAYETLRQIHPSVSRDDTQKTKESIRASLFHQICDIGDIMEDYEADLCQMDDAMSITDDTIGSRSTISKDSFAAHTGGWLCFSPY